MGWEDVETGNSVYVSALGVIYEARQGGENEIKGNIVCDRTPVLMISLIFSILFKSFPFHYTVRVVT